MDPKSLLSSLCGILLGPRPSYWKQRVKLLKHPIQIGNIDRNLDPEHSSGVPIVPSLFASSIMLEGLFDPSDGKLDIKIDFVNS